MFSNGVVITGGTFIQDNRPDGEYRGKGLTFLKEAVASSAFHDSGDRFDRPKCHPNTRVAVIQRLIDWITGKIDIDALILWLYGPAGAGKSAIAQSIAEWCHEQGLLLATFFFSRTDPSRNNIKHLIATLAYKIVAYIPAARPPIEQVVEDDPLIFKCSLNTQFTKLILNPLAHLFETGLFNQISFPPVIIIDGLDECVDQPAQRATLEAFARAGRLRNVPLKLLIASRAEQAIVSSFKSVTLKPITYQFPLNNDYEPDEDIRTFLLAKFEEIKNTHPLGSSIPSSWPPEDTVYRLVTKSSGQFIYASVVIRFASSLKHHPCDRLNIVLGLRPPRRDLPFVELDALYAQILSSAEDVETLLKILGSAIVLLRMPTAGSNYDLRPPRIERILDLEPGTVQLLLGDINSLVHWDSSDKKLEFHHASLPDFLLDSRRSQDLYIDTSVAHSQIARWALRAWKDPDVERDEILHIVEYFQFHCQYAAATPELRQDFWDLPVSAWVSSMANLDAKLSLHSLWYLPPPTGEFSFAYLLVSAVQKTIFPDTQELRAHHLTLVERYMLSLSQDFVGLNSLALFLLLATEGLTLSSDWDGRFAPTRSYPRRFKQGLATLTYTGSADTFQDALTAIFRLPKDDLPWERKTINMLHFRFSKPWNPSTSITDAMHTPPPGYEEFLFDFFSDPRRDEKVRFDSRQCAELAMICTRYLCGHSTGWSHDRRLRPFTQWMKKSRKAPWVWRRLRRNPRLLAWVRREWRWWRRVGVRRCATAWDGETLLDGSTLDDANWEECLHLKHQWADSADRRSLPLRTFSLALHLLPQLLVQSPKAERLVKMVSRAVLHPASVFFVHRTRRAKKAIERYLQRVKNE